MSRRRSIFVIFNPAAGGGRAGKLAGNYARLLRPIGEIEQSMTAAPGEEADLADRALSQGYTEILAVGGDGTWGKVVDRIVRTGRRDVTLGLLPAGTGNDFAKSIGVRADRIESAVRGIAEGRRRIIDVGRAGSRYFLNVVGFGFDIAVIDDALRFPFLHGDFLYRFCALRQLFKYRGLPIAISGGSEATGRRSHLMLTVSNGNYFGGSFRIAPDAKLDDGRLDLVSIYDVGPLARPVLFSRVSKGTHPGHAMVEVRQAPRFTATFDTPVRYELDGDVYDLEGSFLEIEAVPAALSVFVPAG
jgi:diacylglycerol kinase (ATP)